MTYNLLSSFLCFKNRQKKNRYKHNTRKKQETKNIKTFKIPSHKFVLHAALIFCPFNFSVSSLIIVLVIKRECEEAFKH